MVLGSRPAGHTYLLRPAYETDLLERSHSLTLLSDLNIWGQKLAPTCDPIGRGLWVSRAREGTELPTVLQPPAENGTGSSLGDRWLRAAQGREGMGTCLRLQQGRYGASGMGHSAGTLSRTRCTSPFPAYLLPPFLLHSLTTWSRPAFTTTKQGHPGDGSTQSKGHGPSLPHDGFPLPQHHMHPMPSKSLLGSLTTQNPLWRPSLF